MRWRARVGSSITRLCLGSAIAGDVEVVGTRFQQQGNSWTLSTALCHEDSAWDHYADVWQVVIAGKSVSRAFIIFWYCFHFFEKELKNLPVQYANSVLAASEASCLGSGNFMAKKTSLSPDEVSALLMGSPLTVCEWVQKGLLHANVVDGGEHRFTMEDIQAFTQERGLSLSRPDQSRLRILIVDDDLPAACTLMGLFETLSATVEVNVAHTAFDAGRKLVEFRPDVVLLSLLSPANDGFEICRRIRSNYSTRHVRVIVMSESEEQEHKQRILMAGAEACFSKPLNNQQLLETIGLCLEQTGAQQSLGF